jgi:hypothetical protein
MTLTNSRPLRPTAVTGAFDDAPAASALEGTAEALDLLFDGNANGDWTYSATQEGRTGEVAGDTGADMDGEPGLRYDGPAGASVRVNVTDLDIGPSTSASGAPEAADEFTVGLFRNNDIIGHADEGWASEFDTATAEFNVSAVVDNLQPNDVLRVGLMAHEGNEDSVFLGVAHGGSFNIE